MKPTTTPSLCGHTREARGSARTPEDAPLWALRGGNPAGRRNGSPIWTNLTHGHVVLPLSFSQLLAEGGAAGQLCQARVCRLLEQTHDPVVIFNPVKTNTRLWSREPNSAGLEVEITPPGWAEA